MKKLTSTFLLALGASLALAQPTIAEEIITLESTVVGSQEQPKVLYIIPWKQADSLQRLDSSLPQTIGDVFAHKDYRELQREIRLLQNEKDKDKHSQEE